MQKASTVELGMTFIPLHDETLCSDWTLMRTLNGKA
jgi:hypothetical protein